MDIPPDDGFKWFGEGFEGFPKRLPDDCVEYVLYVIDKKLLNDVSATRTRLTQILKTVKELKKDLLQDYIWQRDSFDFRLEGASSTDPSNLAHLKWSLNFGDSIADEWLTVYLLLQLSKKCPDAWIRVYDTDGEFLLIEAANALPKWLNPDTANNRVWISNGHLRLIPIQDGAQSSNLSLENALNFIRNSPDKLIVSPFVEEEAFHRIKDYPKAISTSLHHAFVNIPRRLAYLLHVKPASISPAIEAFYLRDPISLKPLVTKDMTTLTFPPDDLVTVSVTFTKVGYAQLQGQVFEPPPTWLEVADLDDPKVSVGMKLTCGFEMLLRDPQNRDKSVVRELQVYLDDVRTAEQQLPTDSEIETWSQKQDDDSWLDIDYNDFENELSGDKNRKQQSGAANTASNDNAAQGNLRNMVSRFEKFMNDEDAGFEGADEDMDDDTDSDDSGEDKNASYDEAEFERAMKEMMGMPAEEKEKRGLFDEARKLALDDEKEGNEPDEDEDEEMKKVMEAMDRELAERGAIKSGKGGKNAAQQGKKKDEKATPAAQPMYFGPARPPGMDSSGGALAKGDKSKGKARVEELDDTSDVEEIRDNEIGPGDEELSSDEEEFNDVDLNFAKNMLQGLKGQAGMAGPAGNMMKALGVNLPRDEGGWAGR
ncbi:hypothetical protein MBLNU230_g1365t1 [Neophaeotheca triangularis]